MENIFTRAFMAFGRLICCFLSKLLSLDIEKEAAKRPMYVATNSAFIFFLFVWLGLEWLHKPKGTLYSGVVNEDFYVQALLFLAPDEEMEFIMHYYVFTRNLFMVFAFCSSFFPANSNLELCCRVGLSVLAMLAFCYRLIVIKMLMDRKTVKFTPFILCLFMISSPVHWFISGIREGDLFAVIPNGFASFLGAWQLVLYAEYRLNVFTHAFKAFGAALRQLWCFVLRFLTHFQKEAAKRPTFFLYLIFWLGLEWLHKPKGTLYSGVVNEEFYVQAFLFLAPDGEREFIVHLYVFTRNLFTVFALCSSFSPANSNLELCCRVGLSVLAILAFCYRLIVIKMLMNRKTVKFTPFILCLFMFSSAVYWFISGILERDIFAVIPNGFASFLGAWQLILYAKYRLNIQHDI